MMGKGEPDGKPGMPGMPMGPMGMPMGPMGMMRPQMPMGQPGGQVRPAQPQPAPAGGPLSAAPPGVQKQMLGEKLFPQIAKYQPELAGKITGMILEMDNSELLILLESEQQMKSKIDEALRVLESAKAP